MMGSTDKFCLRWNDFESNISASFRELRDDKELFDMTLACEDEQVQAHKVILSACSPFFRNVLRRNKHEHPLLYLKGVKFAELQAVLNFMYQGEVNVAQEDLNSFLSVAEELKIKGLTQTNTAPSPAKSRVRDPPPTPPPPPKRGRPPKNQQQHHQLPPPVTIATAAAQSLVNKSFDNHDDELAPPIVPNVKTEQPPPPISAVEQYTAPTEPIIEYGGGGGGEEFGGDYEMGNYEAGYEDSMMDGGTVSADGNKDPASRDDDPDISGLDVDLDQQIYERMSRLMGSNGEGMMWKCDVCNRRYKDKTKMRHHIETHLDSFVKCPICNQLCKTRRTLKTHIGRSHGKEAASAVNNMSDNIVKLDMCMEPKIELKS